MENEIKELISYMEQQRKTLKTMYKDRIEAKKQKDRIDDKESGFYADLEEEYNNKVKEYDSVVDETKRIINEKKKNIIEKLEKDKKLIDKYRKEYKSEYTELSLMHEEIAEKREALEGAKAHLKWLKATLPPNSEKTQDTISQAETRIKKLEEDFKESIRIVNLIPEGKNAKDTYIDLQEKIKNVDKLNMNNLDEITPKLIKKQEQPVQEQPAQEQPAQEQPAQEQPAQEQPAQGKPEQDKPEQGKPEQDKPEQGKPEQEQTEPTKTEPAETKTGPIETEQTKTGPTKPRAVNSELAIYKPKELKSLKREIRIDAKTGKLYYSDGKKEYEPVNIGYKKKYWKEDEHFLDVLEHISKKYGIKLKSVAKTCDPNIINVLENNPKMLEEYVLSVYNNDSLPFGVSYQLEGMHDVDFLTNREKTYLSRAARKAEMLGAEVKRDSLFERAKGWIKSHISKATRNKAVEEKKREMLKGDVNKSKQRGQFQDISSKSEEMKDIINFKGTSKEFLKYVTGLKEAGLDLNKYKDLIKEKNKELKEKENGYREVSDSQEQREENFVDIEQFATTKKDNAVKEMPKVNKESDNSSKQQANEEKNGSEDDELEILSNAVKILNGTDETEEILTESKARRGEEFEVSDEDINEILKEHKEGNLRDDIKVDNTGNRIEKKANDTVAQAETPAQTNEKTNETTEGKQAESSNQEGHQPPVEGKDFVL